MATGDDRGAGGKILLLAGSPSHGYGAHDHLAGCKLLARALNDAGLPIEATVHQYGWPEDATMLDGVDCVVMYGDGADRHMAIEHLDEIDALAKDGVGVVCLHFSVEAPKGPIGDRFLDWIGGYFELDWSVNPHWTASFSRLPDHPITRGVKPFAIEDEWYYHMRFRDGMTGVTPILTALPPAETLGRGDGERSGNPDVRAAIARGEPQHVAWAVERDDGGRGFGFTGGHVHWNWSDPNFRKVVLNAIVWCAKADVPADGVVDHPVTLADLESNHDEQPPAGFDREAIREKYQLPRPPVLAIKDNQRRFFNGNDLAGWAGNRDLWTVENGEIVGRNTAWLERNEFLFSDMGARNFTLAFEVKQTSEDGQANSGVQFRSEPAEHGEAKGYQADIGAGWWGKIYEELGRGLIGDSAGDQHVKQGGWNAYKIIADGSRVQTWINGKPCVDLDDPDGKRSGIFALQLHSGGPQEVRFRKIELEVLD